MKIVVASYGTEGDARPFAALCRGLMDAGHEARLLADAATLGTAHDLGVPTTALAGDIRGTLDARQSIGSVVSQGSTWKDATRALAAIANEHAESWLGTIIAAAQGCDAVLVAGLAAYAGLSAAEAVGAISIGSGMIPITPTSSFASAFVPPRRVPRLFNRASHGLVNAMLWRAFRDRINAARGRFGLPARRAGWSGHPMVYGISPTLLAPPEDWPANAHLCGQWIRHSEGWTPAPELARFLAAGEAPIYAGFGSMTGFDAQRMTQVLIEAAAGRRLLLHPGWSGFQPSALPPNVLAIGDTPHDWLFPRTCAVIHHGGSGTSHSAARAGVPSIVAPFAADQHFWAERLRLAGVAPMPMDGRRPSTDAFARAIDAAGTAAMRARAQLLGRRLRAEKGVTNAVAVLERIVHEA